MPPVTCTNAPLVLVVRDGWGENPHPEHDAFNAVRLARTPVDRALRAEWPSTLIATGGEDVGLPAGTSGNSEVGHQNIGAGRIVDQQILRIAKAIREDRLREHKALTGAFAHARRTGGNVHLMGLASDGRVHSDLAHLFALIGLACDLDFPGDRLLVHAFTDGRDTGPFEGLGFVGAIEEELERRGVGRIATVIGRYYAMDRDHRWPRIALAYGCLAGRDAGAGDDSTQGVGIRTAASAIAAVRAYYDEPTEPARRGDEYVAPTRIDGTAAIGDGDAVIFFNYRGDRPRQLTKAFTLDDEAWSRVQDDGFDRGARLADLFFCTMTAYEEGLPVEVAFPRPPRMDDILGAVIAEHRLTQFRCAETEKFAHVTYFFNDYREEPFAGERRELIPSPRDVSTYDQKPEMSARGVTDAVLARLDADDGEPLVVVNFANGDMVGHTGVLDATVRAVETVDACVGEIAGCVIARGGSMIITADHGNAEQMFDPETNAPHTSHTPYDVPLIVAGDAFRGRELRTGGRLADIAPTALAMLGIAVPAAMTGTSLLVPS